MSIDSSRRDLLAGTGSIIGLGVAGCTDILGSDDGLTTLTIEADGTDAYLVADVDGPRSASEIVDEGLDTHNPGLSLIAGDRYRFEGATDTLESHPLQFNDDDGDPLLSQEADGTFGDDADVDWVNDDTAVEFTLTESLQEDLTSYQCVIHAGMQGSIGEGTVEDDNGGAGGY